jgi:hypothetical protein
MRWGILPGFWADGIIRSARVHDPGEVACLLTAGNVLGPLPIRLKGRYQPVISTQNAFSTPPPSLLSGI